MNESAARGMGQQDLDELYTRLTRQDVEEFYASYSRWSLQQQILDVRKAIADVQQQIEANTELLQQAQPSAVALATLARLQANGVADIDLLDRMLERGETWLDATMQRLDYCEQLDDFMSDDYEHWCRHALEGAYDWIDSLRQQAEDETSLAETLSPSLMSGEEAAEELLLAKLTNDEEENEDSLLEITQKRPAITTAQLQALASEQIERPAPEQAEPVHFEDGEAENAVEASNDESRMGGQSQEQELGGRPQGYAPTMANDQPGIQEYIVPEDSPVEDDATPADEQPVIQEFAPVEDTLANEVKHTNDEEPALQEFAPYGQMLSTEERNEDGEEPLLQEYLNVAVKVSPEDDAPAGAGDAALREYFAPAEVPGIEGGDDESPDLEHAEEAEEAGESSGQVDAVVEEDAPAREEPVAGASMPTFQWEWQKLPEAVTLEGQAEAQEDEPKRRPHFIWRLLANVWRR